MGLWLRRFARRFGARNAELSALTAELRALGERRNPTACAPVHAPVGTRAEPAPATARQGKSGGRVVKAARFGLLGAASRLSTRVSCRSPVPDPGLRRLAVPYLVPLALVLAWLAVREAGADEQFDSSWYVGAGLGSSTLTPGTGQTPLQVTESQQRAFKVLGGFDINHRWSLEAFVTDLGAATVDDTSGFGQGGKAAFRAAGVGVAVALPDSSPGPSFLLKGGVASVVLDSDLPLEKLEDLQGYFGVGASMQFANGLSVRGEYEYFGPDADLLSLSLVKRFGVKERGKPETEAQQRARLSLAEPPTIVANVAVRPQEPASIVVQRPPAIEGGAPMSEPRFKPLVEAPEPRVEVAEAREPQPVPVLKLRPQDASEVRGSRVVVVRFEPGSAHLTSGTQKILNDVADAFEQEPKTAIVLASPPDDAVSPAVFIARAKALGAYLQGRGVPISRMFVVAAK